MSNDPLTDDDRAQLSARADEFHAALVGGGVGDWGRYLAGVAAHVRPVILGELVMIDLNHRWQRGERPTVEEYVARFPEFGPVERVPPAVVLEEHRCRRKAGEAADPSGFRARFPAQYPAICGEIESGRGATVAGTVVSTIASADGGAAIAQSHSPGGSGSEYEFVRILGRGVFGEVWLARKKGSGIEKAVKVLLQAADHEAADRERRALELIKNLRHPYLLATDDFWIADNRLHIAMELADCTLRDQLRRYRDAGQKGLPLSELLGHMWEAAEGLDFLHSRHVVHRDIKPDNILLLHGHAKVGDFGLARYQEEVLAPMRTFAGTPAYMAPEVWGREGGPASDQYSLAVSYAELRQGVPPLRPRPIQDMLLAHAEGVFEFAEVIADAERAVVLKALSAKPEDRYPSCRAFVEALCVTLDYAGVPRSGGNFTPAVGGDGNFEHVPTERDPDDALATHRAHGRGTAVLESRTSPGEVRPPTGLRRVVLTGVLVAGLATALGLGLWEAFGGRHTDPGDDGKGGPKPPAQTDAAQLPPGLAPAPEAKEVLLADGRRVFDAAQLRIGNETVRFRLVPGAPPVGPFYAQESKVWNALYAAAGASPPAESTANDHLAPVTQVTAEEAMRFAARVPGGRLPTAQEWDHAAGLHADRAGRDEVTLPGGVPRVGAGRPLPTVGPQAGNDVSRFGLRDMAGNGREWTRTLFTPPGQPVKLLGERPPGKDELVILRGRNFTLGRGLSFQDLKDEQAVPQTQFASHRSPYTGFRVVVPLP